jgi:hypothetical protein
MSDATVAGTFKVVTAGGGKGEGGRGGEEEEEEQEDEQKQKQQQQSAAAVSSSSQQQLREPANTRARCCISCQGLLDKVNTQASSVVGLPTCPVYAEVDHPAKTTEQISD